MRWSVEQRLEFVEFRLYWEGRVNRSDLVKVFGISVPQASADLTRYQELAPKNIFYDKTAKAYVATAHFAPIFLVPSADGFLARLRSIAAGVLSAEETWLEQLPPLGSVPMLRRRLPAECLRKVLTFIRSASAVEIEYQSFSYPQPVRRWIAPHSIVFDGFRWHARSWCYSRNDFRDFVLTRMLSFFDTKPAEIERSRDIEWNQKVTLRLGPRPDLSEAERKAVEYDFEMEREQFVEITMRLAIAKYFERLHVLDLDPKSVPSYRQPLMLLNKAEIDAAREDARMRSALHANTI